MSELGEAVDEILKQKPQTVVVLTGAGVSAESGIPTFRGPQGLWRNFRAESLATPEAFARDPALVWEWYEWRRGLIHAAEPNAAHRALARLTHALLVTQNVDGLHTRAGSHDVIELHGSVFRVRCMHEGRVFDANEPFADIPPHCDCGALLRPDVVLFGEMLPPGLFDRAAAAVARADLLLVIGTSGVVYPAAGLVALHQGLSIEINPETSAETSECTFAIAETAANATPAIVDAILAGGPHA